MKDLSPDSVLVKIWMGTSQIEVRSVTAKALWFSCCFPVIEPLTACSATFSYILQVCSGPINGCSNLFLSDGKHFDFPQFLYVLEYGKMKMKVNSLLSQNQTRLKEYGLQPSHYTEEYCWCIQNDMFSWKWIIVLIQCVSTYFCRALVMKN
jgi:hypothetical protein